MNLKLLTTIWFLMLGSLAAMAQNQIIRGKILSGDDNTPLPGVNVLEKGTLNGTVTNGEGFYTITVGTNATLVFSFVGYASQEVAAAGQTTLDVVLSPDVQALNEIVVVGYGQQEKKDVTGSLASVTPRDLNKGIMSSPQDMLIGKIAGVQVSTNDGAPGGASTIRIRGNGSIQASQDPLIVIDGFPVDNTAIGGLSNSLAAINPNDIESYTVLKDASATAIYGLRASNGVIIITTKKGKNGKPQITYNGSVSVANAMKYIDVLSGDEIRAKASELLSEGKLSGFTADAAKRQGTANTDWQKEIYQTAVSHDHNIGVSGTYKVLPYRVSYGYTDQEGILKTTDFKRSSLNVNLTPSFLDGDLDVSVSFKGSYTQQNFGNTGAVGAAVAYDPTQPVYNGSTRWGGYFAWVGPASATTLDPNGDPITLATSNPVALLMQTDNRSNVYRGLGNVKVDYRLPFLPAVKLTVNAGMDYTTSKGHNNATNDAAFTFANGGGQRIDYTGINKSRLLDLYANYAKEIDNHKFDVTLGYSYQRFDRDGSNFGRNGNESVYTDYQTNAEGKAVPRQFVSNPNVLLSFFGRVNYAFNEKYLVTLSFRDDASSRFAKQNRWVVFPAAGVAWRISKESFMTGSKVFSDLKLRASYGVTGQQDVSGNNPYPYLSTYQLSSSTSQYQFGNSFTNTYRPQPYDANLKWETTGQADIGLDFGLLEDKLTGTIDVYQRNTSNLINSIPVAAGSNFSNYLITNVGNLVNKGIEVTLNAKVVQTKNLEWNVGVNYTHNDNEVTKLLKTDDPTYAGIATGSLGLQKNIQNIQVGYPINTFLVYQQVYNAEGKPVEGLYVDRSGQGGDVTASENNKYRYHKPQPDHLFGVNTRVNYKKFDFYMSGRLSLGNYVYNNVFTGANYSNFYYSTGYFNNLPASVNDTQFYSLQTFSDYYVYNASFFKMDNISMGYSVDKLFTQKLKARISFTVQNAFFITKYKGLDPEVNNGIDNNLYPRSRVFMLGVNLTY
ncbi:SusC/RagA family TonB-linked outer membrane protein [Chryseolinea lacunae]|uniref:TonB-dependent receptor n=1 Tax=Chryseolinea lacunae TaxID=2801331 RepID=A0ABS1KM39_9BACT|nr:TonB-dependent receptor [Chryseolinea lacunae]MBL0740516.1 TonB-dependent receptor [Chryseolinea lacunae]